MKVLLTLAVVAVAVSGTAARAGSPSLCVGGPGCFATIQAALDAAHDGDTINVGAGTFQGGITIRKDVQLVGAGAGATTIQGGGPVITVGEFVGPGGPAQPTVSISRVTITGGLVDSEGVAAGGGVAIPFPGPGVPVATVAISDSVIARNRVSPSGLFPPGPFCGPTPCAVAWGGGIDNSGTLTLTDTRVIDNVAGSTPTDASAATLSQGGGIRSHPGATLTLSHSVVSGNRSATSPPNGVFAGGGGIDANGVLTIEGSEISGNTVELSSSSPGSIFNGTAAESESGGIEIEEGASATIASSSVEDNSVTGLNSGGDLLSSAGGIDADGALIFNNSHVDHNRVQARVSPGFNTLLLGGGLDATGTTVTVNNSSVDGNHAEAEAAGGLAAMLGGGISNDGTMTLHNTAVVGNSGHATGAFGPAQGGGIWNGSLGGSAPELTIVGSLIANNTVTGGGGVTPLGGGLFTADPVTLAPFEVTLVHTQITGNQPDQCFGC